LRGSVGKTRTESTGTPVTWPATMDRCKTNCSPISPQRYGRRKRKKNAVSYLPEYNPHKQAIVILGADDLRHAGLDGLLMNLAKLH
jgi:hypothetical protein